jgi:colanic acid/amylovoran biosynthesis protein
MKILISHVYSSNNNGDAAILSAQIAELRRVFRDSNITISTIDQVPRNYTYDDVPVTQALMFGAVAPGRGKLRKLLYAALMTPCTLCWAVVKRTLHIALPLPKVWRSPVQLIETSDIQVCVGGGYLRAKHDLTSTIILLLLVHQIWLARILGKPVYLYAQSFGPYPTRLQRAIAKSGIQSASLVLVREAKSERLLAELGIHKSRIIKVPDSAFLFSAKPNNAVRKMVRPDQRDEIIVGITVRSWLDDKRQTAYEQAIAELIRHITTKPNHKVVVIPQVTSSAQHDDDREAGRRIARLAGANERAVFLEEQFSPRDILSIYASLDYLVGTRFHSVIFALLSHVPAVAIEYEHKTSGIMQDLGLEKWVIPIESVTTKKLTRLYDDIETAQSSYVQRLDHVLPGYIAKSRSAADLIAQNSTTPV